jgi:hypothetical protein
MSHAARQKLNAATRDEAVGLGNGLLGTAAMAAVFLGFGRPTLARSIVQFRPLYRRGS